VPLEQATCDFIYQLLIEHQVIFFRNQPISPQNHLALACAFGEPEGVHPVYPHVEGFSNIVLLKNGPDNSPDTNDWHTDLTIRQEPPFASVLSAQCSVLSAKMVPERGGDTLWLSLSKAYETLPEAIRSELRTMTAVHDMGSFRNQFADGEIEGSKIVAAHKEFGSAIHPIVQTHPVSGRKILFINESFTAHVVGFLDSESNRLLSYLFQHINQPEHQVRFRWTPDSIAIWDNRCTSHYVIAD
jgi:taurine dioxygenase